MSDRIAVMREGRFVQIGSAQEIYDRPRTSYVARFVGNANIIRVDGRMLAVRSEQILLDGQETPGALAAVVKEKSFVGGMLRIGLELTDGTPVTASRHGIDAAWQPGERLYVSWRPEHGVPVEKDETAAGEEVDEEAL